MQLAKVVIVSVLVLAVCAEGLPEGKDCVVRCTADVTFKDFASCIPKLCCSACAARFTVLGLCVCTFYIIIHALNNTNLLSSG